MSGTKKIILLFSLCLSKLCFCNDEIYKEIKKRITKLENSIIQDYTCDLPSKGVELTQKEQVRLVNKVKTRYNIQRALFYNIEEELLEIGNKINQNLKSKTLSQVQFNELQNGIDYANRIILQPRKQEIDALYLQFLGRIKHKPALSDVLNKLHQINGEQCEVANINYNQEEGYLSFQIKQNNSFGNVMSTPFVITNDDIDNGLLKSQLENRQKFNPFHTIVTNYSKVRALENQKSSFVFHQDEFGKVKAANFLLEKDIPLVRILGIEFGKQKITQKFDCGKPKHQISRLPASYYK